MVKKRILILTADAGFGHRSAANAIAAALRERYSDRCEVEILNPMEDRRTPFFLRDSQSDYDRLVRLIPELYRFYFDASDKTVTSAVMEGALTVLLFETMRDLVRSYVPDAIVSTYPLYHAPLEAVFTLRGEDIPVLTVVTDLATIHRLWFSRAVDACLVPNSIVQDLAFSYGLNSDQVMITGIPVNPEILSDTRSADEIRRELGWIPGMTTFLAVGSRRVERLLDTLNVLNHFGQPVQLAVVAGRDQKLYDDLQHMEWHVPVFLYEYVSNVPLMMRAADAVICKAGGLIVTESLASGRPMLLVDAIPGQETGNADLVVRSGAGDLARSEREVLETVAHWLRDGGKLLAERAARSAELGKPHAAYDVAEQAYQAALRGASQHRHLFSRRTLIDLFNRNEVRWGDTRELKDHDSK
jgi:1,2-diacylglycerol 3-beta-galactosyltransferase